MDRNASVNERNARFSSASGPVTATAVSMASPTRRCICRLEPSPAISRMLTGGLPKCCLKSLRKIFSTSRLLYGSG